MTKIVVFDMGGVLFEFQGDRLIAETSRRTRRWRSDEVQKKWIPLAREFETGAVTEREFAASIVHAYGSSSPQRVSWLPFATLPSVIMRERSIWCTSSRCGIAWSA